MSDLKISHRCPSCGAFVREIALFCSRCGDTLTRQPKVAGQAESREISPVDLEASALRSETESAAESHVDDVIVVPHRGSTRTAAVESARDKVHRATATARDVIEGDVLYRVEKLRQISTVVLDEAAYDPSLRFVLVAAALFVLFLVILLLSELIT